MTQVPDRLGPYELIAPLGAGGMGEVYQARDVRLNRVVAIKVLATGALERPQARERFEREARAIAALNHPHICTLHDIGHDAGVDFLVMEYVDGKTLAARLADAVAGPLPIDEAIRYARQIAEAIDAAHRAGITHRDLKPSNIMLTKSGAKLLDFGVAKLRRPAPAIAGLQEDSTHTLDITREGALVGTVRYMAPEVLDGKPADARSDLFSYGTVVYEMVTGKPAFNGSSDARLVAAILNEEPPPILTVRPEAPPAIDWIVRTCLAKDPDERWQDARDVVRQLRLIDQGHAERLPTPTPLPAERPAPRRGRTRWRWAAPALLATVLASVAAVIAYRWFGVAPPPPHLVALPCRGDAAPNSARAFCDGLSAVLVDGLIRLTRSHRLQVTPYSYVPRRQDIRTPEDALRILGATRVLQAGVQRADDGRLRLEYRLADPTGSAPSVSQTFTVDPQEPLTARYPITAWLVRNLALDLQHAEREALVRSGTTIAAHGSYLVGRGYDVYSISRFANPLAEGDSAVTDLAIEAFERAVQQDSSYADAYAALGLAYWKRHEQSGDRAWRDRARTACEQAIRLQPASSRGHACLGTILFGTGESRAAAAPFERSVEADPTDDEANVWLGRVYEASGDSANAERVYRRAVEHRPHYSAVHQRLGNYYMRQGRYGEARDAFTRALGLIPPNARGYAILAVPSMYLGDYDRAVASLRKSVQIHPTPEGYVNWAMTLYRMRRFEEAAALMEKALELGERLTPARRQHLLLGNLARAYYWNGRRAQADRLFAEAIDLAEQEVKAQPTARDVRIAVADYYAKRRRFTEAREHLREVGVLLNHPLRPGDPHQLFFAAIVHNQLGDRAAALAWLERAVYWGVPIAELRASVELDNLRSDPSFQALVQR
jgi:tetratricopeptide (TPR) repeat protein